MEEIRRLIKKSAPDAIETIKYGMPAYILNGSLIYFAAYKNYIGVYQYNIDPGYLFAI